MKYKIPFIFTSDCKSNMYFGLVVWMCVCVRVCKCVLVFFHFVFIGCILQYCAQPISNTYEMKRPLWPWMIGIENGYGRVACNCMMDKAYLPYGWYLPMHALYSSRRRFTNKKYIKYFLNISLEKINTFHVWISKFNLKLFVALFGYLKRHLLDSNCLLWQNPKTKLSLIFVVCLLKCCLQFFKTLSFDDNSLLRLISFWKRKIDKEQNSIVRCHHFAKKI